MYSSLRHTNASNARESHRLRTSCHNIITTSVCASYCNPWSRHIEQMACKPRGRLRDLNARTDMKLRAVCTVAALQALHPCWVMVWMMWMSAQAMVKTKSMMMATIILQSSGNNDFRSCLNLCSPHCILCSAWWAVVCTAKSKE